MLQADVALHVVQHLRAAWHRAGKLVIGFVLGALVTAGFALARPLWHPGGANADFALRVAVPSSGPGLASAIYQTLGATLRPGHHIELLENGAVFDALIGDVQRARSSVHIVMYIWEAGRASDRLCAALIERPATASPAAW
jgi:cardiolipin synthase